MEPQTSQQWKLQHILALESPLFDKKSIQSKSKQLYEV